MVKIFHGEEELKLETPSYYKTVSIINKTFDKPVTVVFEEEPWANVTFWECVFNSSLIIKKKKENDLKNGVCFSKSSALDIVLQSPIRIDVETTSTFKSITQSFNHE